MAGTRGNPNTLPGGAGIANGGPHVGEPLGRAGSLSLRIARRSLRRLRRARRALAAPASRGAAPLALPALDLLAATLRTLPPEARDRVLRGPDVRGFLSEAETWIEVRRLARLLLRTPGHRGRGAPPGGRDRRSRLVTRLFDLVSRTQHLVTLVPHGRLDAGFPSRCLRFADRRLQDAAFDLAAVVLGLRLAHPGIAGVSVALRFRQDPEQGRPVDRIDLGTVAGPAGPLAIAPARRREARGPRSAARRRRGPDVVRATLRGATLTVAAPGAGATVIPAAGTPLADHGPARGRPGRPGGPAFRLLRRELIPGTSILLSPVVESRPKQLRVGREVRDLGRRLARALRVVLLAWPEAHREIERRTFMVVPIREQGTVSYSMAARPGISYINVFGKSLIDLADDLLHETAHHRLHDLQETAALLRPGPDTQEVQAFDSPWRGTRRPLHGLLHGAYTFLFRAELFSRLLRVVRAHPRTLAVEIGPSGRAFLRRERARERRMIAAGLRDLDAAARAGLLAAAGRRLVREMRARSAGLSDERPRRAGCRGGRGPRWSP